MAYYLEHLSIVFIVEVTPRTIISSPSGAESFLPHPVLIRVAPKSDFDRIPKTEDLRSWKFSEYRRPNIFLYEKFPNNKYRIVFVHKKFLNIKDFLNTKYWIVFIYKIVWIPNNKEENKSNKKKKREKRKENYRKNVRVIVMWHAY